MSPQPLKIAVIGAGISGMSAAWLLSQRHHVTVYEAEDRLGGHSHTVEAGAPGGRVPVDMGFIVYNEPNYPNLVALFEHLGVPTQWSDMSFGVSVDGGGLEYSSSDMLAQPRNLVRPRFWSMISDLMRFYREAPGHACALDSTLTSLGDYLSEQRYGRAFMDDHLLPQAAAIWSASVGAIRDFPAASFIRFCENHGLLQVSGRVEWRTVCGGSREYVRRLTATYADRVKTGCAARQIVREAGGVIIRDAQGHSRRFDHVVIAAHADQGLKLLVRPSRQEEALLGAFSYSRNLALLHTDAAFMPRRKRAWSAWNYVDGDAGDGRRNLCVTYWMNRLQNLPHAHPLFVTLNPGREPAAGTLLRSEVYEHPLFDAAATRAQRELWTLQGSQNTWWCGAYFGSGFHEDGLQSGLAVAEALGGVRRPWNVEGESSRIILGPLAGAVPLLEGAA
jgi:predicted NAD/FAD-binding protein